MAVLTRQVLPSVHKWIGRLPDAPVTFRLSQVLTGNRVYNGYLHRFGTIPSPSYAHCSAPLNNVEHTLFDCPFWDDLRAEVVAMLGRSVRPGDIEELICG